MNMNEIIILEFYLLTSRFIKRFPLYLNNSGKSTIVNHFKNPEEKSSVTVPTVGFSVEKFQSK